jgi:hypothetical protein
MSFGRRSYTAVMLAAASVPAALASQIDSTAGIRGTASSTFNGHPLAGVMISVPAVRRFAVSDSTGRFELAGLPPGRQHIRISYEGRDTQEYDFDLRRGKVKKVVVLLDVEAVDLAPVVVEAQARDFSRNLAGFYDRKKWYGGFARFFTREDLERAHLPPLSSVLARDGIFVRCLAGGCIPVRWYRGALCAVSVSVDGMPFWEQDYDRIAAAEVQAVEVYRNPLWGMPLMPQIATEARSSSFNALPTCGAVLIWTR